MLLFDRPQDIEVQLNSHSQAWKVLELWPRDSGAIYIHEEGMPSSLLPEQGERLGVLGTIPISDQSISLIGSHKQTSDLVVTCRNPNNLWGKLFYRTKLLRRAAAVVSLVYKDINDWNYRHQQRIGHVVGLTMFGLEVHLQIQI